jgi:hypothetical protein
MYTQKTQNNTFLILEMNFMKIGSNFGDFGDFGEEVFFESFDVYSPNLRHKIENFGQNSFYRAEILTSLA